MRALRDMEAQGLMECLLDESAVEGAAEVDATAASQSDRVAVILLPPLLVAVAVPMP